jgi:hypothetical protein
MAQVFKDLKPLLNDSVRFLACDIDDKPDPAGVFFLFRVVEALLRWKPGNAHRSYLVRNGGVYATGLRLYQKGNHDG